MVRSSIRDSRSDKSIKPRVMDYIKNDNGEELLEVKDGNTKKTILLKDFETQLNYLRLNS